MACPAVVAAVLLAVLPALVRAQVHRVDQQQEWQSWSYPAGTVAWQPDGALQLAYFRRGMDPLQDAAGFQHPTLTRGSVSGNVKVYSRLPQAARLTDRDSGTWWQPDPADGVDQWWVEVDLGRVVLLEQVRLVFPDTVGARPFRDFSVYVSEGSTMSPTADLFRFTRVATTTRPNTERTVQYALSTVDRGEKAIGDGLVSSLVLPYAPVQYLRFVPHQLSREAALAEIELVAVGDDIGLGTFARGGSVRSSPKFVTSAGGLFDGTVDLYWNASAARAAEAYWRDGGQWFEWDLGAAFWLDQIVLFTWDPLELGRSAFLADSGQLGYELLVSSGDQTALTGGSQDRIMGEYNYERLSLVDNTATPRRWLFDHHFTRRQVRYLFYHHDLATDRYGFNIFEVFLYGQGYPARVELVSGLIDLGSPRSFTGLSWDAQTPPGTSVELSTRTGDQLGVETRYYHKNGKEITKEQWERLPQVSRGAKVETVREGPDWSGWSERYAEPGEAFRSPSPRRYVRLKLVLASEDPERTPVLRSLSVFHQEPLVRGGAAAEILPREVALGSWQEFSYRIRPDGAAGDRGFDGILIAVPGGVTGPASVLVGGRPVSGAVVDPGSDTVRVALPALVRRDSVEVRFTARPMANPTFFAGYLSNSVVGARQELKPAHRVALQVFVPEVATVGLIAQLAAGPAVVTPNGDGVNDSAELTFDLLRADLVPRVGLYDLSGRLVRALTGVHGSRQRYTWDGTGDNGALARPGIYLWRVELDAGIGQRTEHRLVSLAY